MVRENHAWHVFFCVDIPMYLNASWEIKNNFLPQLTKYVKVYSRPGPGWPQDPSLGQQVAPLNVLSSFVSMILCKERSQLRIRY